MLIKIIDPDKIIVGVENIICRQSPRTFSLQDVGFNARIYLGIAVDAIDTLDTRAGKCAAQLCFLTF